MAIEPEEVKEEIVNAMREGKSVSLDVWATTDKEFRFIDENNQVNGGHEITIIGYQKDENGTEYFICNDTDDEIDSAVSIKVSDLLPKIHHAGISREALSSEDVIVEPWKEYIEWFQQVLKAE